MRCSGAFKAFQWIMKWKGACPCILNLLPFPKKILRVKRQTKSEISDPKFFIHIKWGDQNKNKNRQTTGTISTPWYRRSQRYAAYHMLSCVCYNFWKGLYGNYFHFIWNDQCSIEWSSFRMKICVRSNLPFKTFFLKFHRRYWVWKCFPISMSSW